MKTSALLAIVRADISIPNPQPSAPPGLDGVAGLFISFFEWGAVILGVIAIVVAAITLAWARRHPEGNTGHLVDLMKPAIGIGIALNAAGIGTMIYNASTHH